MPSIAMKFFPLNHAWAFTFGDAMLKLPEQPLFFVGRLDAMKAARDRGISVAEDGTCYTKTTNMPDCFQARATVAEVVGHA